jgi:Flp pilus assembly protein TadB
VLLTIFRNYVNIFTDFPKQIPRGGSVTRFRLDFPGASPGDRKFIKPFLVLAVIAVVAIALLAQHYHLLAPKISWTLVAAGVIGFVLWILKVTVLDQLR